MRFSCGIRKWFNYSTLIHEDRRVISSFDLQSFFGPNFGETKLQDPPLETIACFILTCRFFFFTLFFWLLQEDGVSCHHRDVSQMFLASGEWPQGGDGDVRLTWARWNDHPGRCAESLGGWIRTDDLWKMNIHLDEMRWYYDRIHILETDFCWDDQTITNRWNVQFQCQLLILRKPGFQNIRFTWNCSRWFFTFH